MRIVFVGAVEFSRSVLDYLLSLHASVVGVCTLRNSKSNADHVDLASTCESNSIPWTYAEDINSAEALAWISEKAPDVIFCFGWSRLLKHDLLALAPLGVIGFHPSALPANRGRHPLIWALVLGLRNTASTFFFMDVGADSGDILSQDPVEIDDVDDARTLYEKVTKTALAQIGKFLPQLESGGFPRLEQDTRLANTWRKRGQSDGAIDWRMSASAIHNLVRGLSKPYVGAHFENDGREYKVWKTRVVNTEIQNIEPGKVLSSTRSEFVVKCGDAAICLMVTEPSFEPVVGTYL